MRHKILAVLGIVALLGSMLVAVASADVPTDTTALRNAVTEENIWQHLKELQKIANRNGGNRASGTPGYDASADYVASKLQAAGYLVTVQPFDFTFFEELIPAVLDQVAPGSVSYTYGVDYYTMDYSGSGDVTALVQAVDLLLPPTGGSTSGCEATDFTGFTAGKIALIQRGTCTFREKALNAQQAGAVGVIVFNEGNTPDRVPLFGGTLGGPGVNIPVVSASFALGVALNDLIDDGLMLHLMTNTVSEVRSTSNVIGETPGGRDDRVVVVGAHLDSVTTAAGINDNGSGVAVILEIALQMAKLGVQPVNKVHFAFWGAEESGLLGAEYYVSQLGKDIKDLALNLNFDMVASPTYERFVYDGDGSDTPDAGPTGSANVEDVFLDYFASQGLPTAPTALDGRSDYQPFFDVGIPVGGLFTGAEGYDPCYHTPCDDIKNTNEQALDEMSDAAAHTVLTFAMTQSDVSGTAKASIQAATYKGPKAQK